MTLGMKISLYRKELGLSQEALGEKLGISRQAISKWEADAAIPEIDKLIALSKLFSVPVGQLLGVEEPTPTEPADSGELSERQEQMIEEIVSRYVAAMPKPKKMSTWKKVALAAAVVIVVGWYVISINDRISSMQNSLSNQISNIQGSTSSQINSISTRLQEIMEQGSSILMDSAAWVKDYDLNTGNYTFYVSVSPKDLREEAECWFTIRNSQDSSKYVEQQVMEEQAGNFTCEMNWPEAYGDNVLVSVEFREEGLTRVEGIDFFQELSSYGRPSLLAYNGYGFAHQGTDNTLTLTWDYMDFFLDYNANGYISNEDIPDPVLEVFYNGKLLDSQPLDISESSAELLDLRPSLSCPMEAPLSEGEDIGVFLRITDIYDRQYRVFLSWCEWSEDGSNQLLDGYELQNDTSEENDMLLPEELIEQFSDGDSSMIYVWYL